MEKCILNAQLAEHIFRMHMFFVFMLRGIAQDPLFRLTKLYSERCLLKLLMSSFNSFAHFSCYRFSTNFDFSLDLFNGTGGLGEAIAGEDCANERFFVDAGWHRNKQCGFARYDYTRAIGRGFGPWWDAARSDGCLMLLLCMVNRGHC